MRLAFAGLAPGADPLQIGGQQSILRRLARALRACGHQVDFYVLDAMPAQPLDATWGIWRFSQLDALMATLQRQPYDYVQFSRVPLRLYPILIQGMYRIRSRRGYLYLVHQSNPVLRWTRRLLFHLAFDQVFVVSPRLQAELATFRKPVHLLWPPVPPLFLEAGAQRAAADNAVRIAYLGRLSRDRGVVQAVRAFEHVTQLDPRVRAEVFGYATGAAADHVLYQALTARQNSRLCYTVVDVANPTSNAVENAVLATLRRSDIVVLPYLALDRLTIDIPLLLLEAMAVGCVVLSSAVGDIPAILGDPAFVCQPDALSQNLERLIRAGGLLDRGQGLRRQVLVLGVDLKSVTDAFLAQVERP